MNRRNFLKRCSLLLPFVGSLAVVAKAGASEGQPEDEFKFLGHTHCGTEEIISDAFSDDKVVKDKLSVYEELTRDMVNPEMAKDFRHIPNIKRHAAITDTEYVFRDYFSFEYDSISSFTVMYKNGEKRIVCNKSLEQSEIDFFYRNEKLEESIRQAEKIGDYRFALKLLEKQVELYNS